MNKLLKIVFLLFLIFVSPAYGSSSMVFNVGVKNITYTDSILKEFATSYLDEYVKTMEFSGLPDSYRDYRIDETYAFLIYKDRPFNIDITVFNDGFVIDYIPQTTAREPFILRKFNESFNSLLVSPAYVNMKSSRHGIKFKRTYIGSEKFIETLIVFSNSSINTNPKKFASEIVQYDFRYDLTSVMGDKLRNICELYGQYPNVYHRCETIKDKLLIDDFYKVKEFESDFQDLNKIIPHYRDIPLMAEKWYVFNDSIINFSIRDYPDINNSYWIIINDIVFNESYTLTNLNDDLPKLNSMIQAKSYTYKLEKIWDKFKELIGVIFGDIRATVVSLIVIAIIGYLQRKNIYNYIKK